MKLQVFKKNLMVDSFLKRLCKGLEIISFTRTERKNDKILTQQRELVDQVEALGYSKCSFAAITWPLPDAGRTLASLPIRLL